MDKQQYAYLEYSFWGRILLNTSREILGEIISNVGDTLSDPGG